MVGGWESTEYLSIRYSYYFFPLSSLLVISKSVNNMKTSFTLRDFSISTADDFDQKQVLLVVKDSSEIPVLFQNPFLKATLDASKFPDEKFLTIE